MAQDDKRPIWPVRVAALGPTAMASVLWRHRGQLYATVVVKASFAFSIDDDMSCVVAQPIRRSDECARGVPSLRGASEIAPRKLEVDVTLHGHAFAQPGSLQSRVRLAMEREGRLLLDKTVLIVGNRKRGRPDIAPFERMRLGYERAYGGIGCADNPIGVGADPASDVLPNVIDPHEAGRVAGFGAISCRFPSRRALRGKLEPALMEEGIADYPPDFDWRYFQASPTDQRLPALHGDEWLVLDGMHPSYPRIRTRLPSPRAHVRAYTRKPLGVPEWLPLALDTLHVEADDARCSLVWRGAFPVVSELTAEQLVLAGGLELRHHLPTWPATIEEAEQMASPACDTGQLRGGIDSDLQRTAQSYASAPAEPVRRLVPPAPPSAPLDATVAFELRRKGALPSPESAMPTTAPLGTPAGAGKPGAVRAAPAMAEDPDWAETIMAPSLEQAEADPPKRR